MRLTANKNYSIARRIIIQFCLFAVLLSLLFSFYNFVFLYTLEDGFLERSIKKEAQHLATEYKRTGIWLAPRKSNMTLYFDSEKFPREVKVQFKKDHKEREFYGKNGLHYHLYIFKEFSSVYLLAEVSEELVVRPLRRVIIILLVISTLILTFIACLIGYKLSRRTIKPLTDLVELVNGVEPNKLPKNFAGNFPNNEIGILATTLETAMARINDFVSREQHFTRDASHELRTPIAIIKNATELLNQQNLTSDESKTLITRISRASLQMEQTVNALLSLAREENTDPIKQAVKVLPIVEKVIVQHAYLLTDKPVEVEINIKSTDQVMSDEPTVYILIANLIGNAFHYTLAGLVTVSFENNTLTISDTGPGIDKAIENCVLEPMIKGQHSKGFGIGLSIVKRLCEHHKLNLVINNTKHGMMVNITFPHSI